MATDKAIKIRDQLNGIIEELMLDKDDQEANILACCVALSVEEIEKWAYNGEFTPSVAPIVNNKILKIPCKPGEEDDEQWMGPPWARVKKTALSGMDALNRLKARAANKAVVVKSQSILDKWNPGDWTPDVKNAFARGSAPFFILAVRKMIEPAVVSGIEVSDYLNRMKSSYGYLWGTKGNV